MGTLFSCARRAQYDRIEVCFDKKDVNTMLESLITKQDRSVLHQEEMDRVGFGTNVLDNMSETDRIRSHRWLQSEFHQMSHFNKDRYFRVVLQYLKRNDGTSEVFKQCYEWILQTTHPLTDQQRTDFFHLTQRVRSRRRHSYCAWIPLQAFRF